MATKVPNMLFSVGCYYKGLIETRRENTVEFMRKAREGICLVYSHGQNVYRIPFRTSAKYHAFSIG